MNLDRHKRILSGIVFGWVVVAALAPHAAASDDPVAASRGASVYVPVYSHIYFGDRDQRLDLTATVSIRNTDPKRSIRVVSADYHDSAGKVVRAYLDKPVDLAPLSATRLVVKESDRAGGSGASFVVRWSAESPASPPIMEAVMVGTAGNRGMSFTSRGRIITATDGSSSGD